MGFTGSTMWQHTSKIIGTCTYDLVQIIDEHGNHLEPAWGACQAEMGKDTRLHYTDYLDYGPQMAKTHKVLQDLQQDLQVVAVQHSTYLDPRTFATSVAS